MPRPSPVFVLTHAPRLDQATDQPPHVVVRVAYRQALIRAANEELLREGSTFAAFATKCQTDLEQDDDGSALWLLAQAKLADAGRLFVACEDTEPGRAWFLRAAAEHGVEAQAQALLRRWAA